MFRVLALAAVLAVSGLAGANAASIRTFTGDVQFNSECSQNGAFANDDCELGVGEMRIGTGGLTGDWEVGIGIKTARPGTAQAAWPSGVARDFTFAYDGAGLLSLQVEGVGTVGDPDPLVSVKSDQSAMNRLYIRVRSENSGQKAELTDMVFSQAGSPDVLLGDLGGTTFGSSGAAYLVLSGVDFASAWMLTGKTALSFTNQDGRSNIDINFKTANLPAVPLPPAAMFLLTAVGGLAGLRTLGRRPA